MSEESRLEILVVEEFGYGHWVWSPGLEARDLLAWFRGIDPKQGDRGNRLLFMDLIGTFERVKNEDLADFHARFKDPDFWSAHIHMPDDSYIRAELKTDRASTAPPNFHLIRALHVLHQLWIDRRHP